MTITLQALSLVEKAEPVQVRFTLRLRGQQSMWMQDGCKVYMDSYMASYESCFPWSLGLFPKPSLGGRPNTKPRDQCHSERSQPLIYSILSCVGTRMNRNLLK
jgi:hypothetical protein